MSGRSVSEAVKPDLGEAGSQMTRNRYGNLASESIGWVLHGTVLEEPLKSSKILGNVDSIVDSGFVISARNLASFTGQIISTSLSFREHL